MFAVQCTLIFGLGHISASLPYVEEDGVVEEWFFPAALPQQRNVPDSFVNICTSLYILRLVNVENLGQEADK